MHGRPHAQALVGDDAEILDGERGVGALHAVGVGGQRDVRPIVDNQPGARHRGAPSQLAREAQELRAAEILLSKLHGGQTRGQAFADHGEQIPAAGLRPVRDEAESQLLQSGTPSRGEDAVA